MVVSRLSIPWETRKQSVPRCQHGIVLITEMGLQLYTVGLDTAIMVTTCSAGRATPFKGSWTSARNSMVIRRTARRSLSNQAKRSTAAFNLRLSKRISKGVSEFLDDSEARLTFAIECRLGRPPGLQPNPTWTSRGNTGSNLRRSVDDEGGTRYSHRYCEYSVEK